MKTVSALSLSALVVAVAAQTPPGLPECFGNCIEMDEKRIGCCDGDVKCYCEQLDVIADEKARQCTINSCGGDQEWNELIPQLEGFCVEYLAGRTSISPAPTISCEDPANHPGTSSISASATDSTESVQSESVTEGPSATGTDAPEDSSAINGSTGTVDNDGPQESIVEAAAGQVGVMGLVALAGIAAIVI